MDQATDVVVVAEAAVFQAAVAVAAASLAVVEVCFQADRAEVAVEVIAAPEAIRLEAALLTTTSLAVAIQVATVTQVAAFRSCHSCHF